MLLVIIILHTLYRDSRSDNIFFLFFFFICVPDVYKISIDSVESLFLLVIFCNFCFHTFVEFSTPGKKRN